uniref:Uncharacterized protein n=1 Tax=Solanum lycopersicum TaxID=4081 RepID=A0A3Q7HM81_SOLLC
MAIYIAITHIVKEEDFLVGNLGRRFLGRSTVLRDLFKNCGEFWLGILSKFLMVLSIRKTRTEEGWEFKRRVSKTTERAIMHSRF